VDAETRRHDQVGLCFRCRHVRIIRTDRGSMFYQCSRAAADPSYPRYPILPMLECGGFEETPIAAEQESSSGPAQTR
jgi:hypothetical protein